MSLIKRRVIPRGFTIVELLIVIVIIGILSTLVFVSYSGISDMARKAALSSNAQSVLRSLKVHLVDNEDFDPLTLDETNVQSTLNMDASGYETLALYNQSGENYIYIVGKANFTGLIACGIQGAVNVYKADEAVCAFGGSGNVVAAVTDTTPGALGGGNGSTCALAKTIDSIEDLVFLSTSTNSGTTYSGICIKLTTDLDFTQSKSYVDKNTVAFGDLNGNGSTEGLKTELTTAAGFVPIGGATNYFRGTFIGDLHTIYNMAINRPATDYIALFGKSSGIIRTLNLIDASVVGKNFTSLLVGMSSNGSIINNDISGNVTGANYVALVCGQFAADAYRYFSSISANGNVNGIDLVAGIVGQTYYTSTDMSMITSVNAYYSGGAITATGANKNRIVGGQDRAYSARPYIKISSLAFSNVTVNGSTTSSTNTSSFSGSNISNLSDLNDINLAETVFDTYIGGDNDSDGYYWDYDDSNVLTRKNTADDPILFTLTGLGTLVDPYIINDASDLKQASTKQNVYYKLNADIDMTNNNFYMLGSYANPMKGTFIGALHTISNIIIDAPGGSFIGFAGYVSGGKITALDLDGINVLGGDYTAGVIGYSASSQVTECNVRASVTGSNYVGMIAGRISASSSTMKISSNIIEGNVSGVSNVGGAVGESYNDYGSIPINVAFKSGSVVGTGSNIGRFLGNDTHYTGSAYASISSLSVSSVTVNGSTISSTSTESKHGSNISSYLSIFDDINLAENVLDTYIGGDNDGNGYYWDYDGTNVVVRKNTTDSPITFTLAGAGTTISPYIINSASDLRQASTKQNVTYKLSSDIYMDSQKFYMLSSYSNRMTGVFIGSARTISNITINASGGNFIGFSGFMNGGSKVSGLKLSNMSVTGSNFSSLMTGYLSSGTVSDNLISGSLTGATYVGMTAGYMSTSSTNNSTNNILSGTVIGVSNTGGAVGESYNNYGTSNIKNIFSGVSITGTGSNINRILGNDTHYTGSAYATISSKAISSTTVNGSTVISASLTSRHGKDIVAVDLSNSTTYTEIGFNFTDEALDYIWYIDGASATFREGTL